MTEDKEEVKPTPAIDSQQQRTTHDLRLNKSESRKEVASPAVIEREPVPVVPAHLPQAMAKALVNRGPVEAAIPQAPPPAPEPLPQTPGRVSSKANSVIAQAAKEGKIIGGAEGELQKKRKEDTKNEMEQVVKQEITMPASTPIKSESAIKIIADEKPKDADAADTMPKGTVIK